MKAKKRFGQNFLIDKSYINRIVDSINVFSNDLIIEIGPGRGALTKLLKEKGCSLICYEVDLDLKEYLSTLESDNTKIIYEDFLKVKKVPKNYDNLYIIGNLPYYITTPILEHVIEQKFNPKEMVIMVQKEVADRFLASPHTKEYGYFTLYLRHYFDITRITNVPSHAFNPAPKVESTVLKLTRKENKIKLDEKKYQEFLKTCFKQKRKQLKNNLDFDIFKKIEPVLEKYNLSENVRAEEIPEEVFVEMFQSLD